ncbi:MAG: cyclic-di-AMP receptor, partial [Thomasclavelia spiroformis]
GNTTFLIGTNDDKVDDCISVIKAKAKKRVEKEPTIPPTEMGEFFTPIMVDVLVGGATVFVLNIDQFEKF